MKLLLTLVTLSVTLSFYSSLSFAGGTPANDSDICGFNAVIAFTKLSETPHAKIMIEFKKRELIDGKLYVTYKIEQEATAWTVSLIETKDSCEVDSIQILDI